MALPHAPSQTPPPAPIETFARYHQGSRLHPRTAQDCRRSITFDNDTAFAQHALLRTMRAMTTWFCDAHASWQKGGVENANGRLRRWLPRQIDIDQCPTKKFRTSSSPPISRPESAWASRPLSRQSSKSLAKTCKSASLSPVALGSRIQGWLRSLVQLFTTTG